METEVFLCTVSNYRGSFTTAVSSSSAGGWRAINNANLFLYLILTSMIKLANQEEMNLRSEGTIDQHGKVCCM